MQEIDERYTGVQSFHLVLMLGLIYSYEKFNVTPSFIFTVVQLFSAKRFTKETIKIMAAILTMDHIHANHL